MSYTGLSVIAVPGADDYTFSPKKSAVLPRPFGYDYTELSVIGVPGPIRQFGHSGAFTELSAISTPGTIRAFLHKKPADIIPHEGEFTALQVYALPGKRRVFLAKTEAEIIAVSTAEEIMGPPDQDFRFYNRVIREDDEILTFILNAVTSGILDS